MEESPFAVRIQNNLMASQFRTFFIESYNKEKWRDGINFTIRLEGFTNSFSVPTPEWKSFDFESFKSSVREGDNIVLNIPEPVEVNSTVINVFQIRVRNKTFIDFEKMISERKLEMYLSFTFGILSLIGIIHHHYRPWRF